MSIEEEVSIDEMSRILDAIRYLHIPTIQKAVKMIEHYGDFKYKFLNDVWVLADEFERIKEGTQRIFLGIERKAWLEAFIIVRQNKINELLNE
jgi:hypothetical protein